MHAIAAPYVTIGTVCTIGFIAVLGQPALGSLPGAPLNPAKSAYERNADLSEPEHLRIRRHLSRVAHELSQQTPPGLAPAQLEARRRRLDDLRAYLSDGFFPRNDATPGALHPVFIDRDGVPCAVGHLIIASGERSLAESIAGRSNLAYIPELRDARLTDWMRRNGLTLEECARIQPSYTGTYWSRMRDIAVDPQGRPWVIAEDAIQAAGYGVGYQEPERWRVLESGYSFRSLCLSPAGKAFVGAPGGAWWEGQPRVNSSAANPVETYGCAWASDSVVWAGGAKGVIRFRLDSQGIPSPTDTTAVGIFAGEAIPFVALSRDRLWAASTWEIASTSLDGGAWSKDSAAPLDGDVTGLEADTHGQVWVGLDGPRVGDERFSRVHFSGKGLRIRNSQGTWYSLRKGEGALPGDTVEAVWPRGDGFLLLACAGGIHELSPEGALRRTADAGELPINAMSGDSAGILYLGTESGLVRLEGNARMNLGALSSMPIRARERAVRKESASRSLEILLSGRNGATGRTLLGRQAAGLRAAGVLLPRPTSAEP
jgi:hypothetical protein